MDDKYYLKYLKYKLKYLELKNNRVVKIKRKQKRKIYSNVKKSDLDKLIFTEESLYSVSKIKGSKFLIDVIRQYFSKPKEIILTDATANVGSDSINLSYNLKKVNAIEIDEINYKALVNNINVLKVRNIETFNSDSNKIISTLKQDIIYVDAPWGGRDYKTKKKLDLYLGDINISQFYLNNRKHAKLFIFKVPYNYNLDLMQEVAKVNVHKFMKNGKLSYLLLVINNIN